MGPTPLRRGRIDRPDREVVPSFGDRAPRLLQVVGRAAEQDLLADDPPRPARRQVVLAEVQDVGAGRQGDLGPGAEHRVGELGQVVPDRRAQVHPRRRQPPAPPAEVHQPPPGTPAWAAPGPLPPGTPAPWAPAPGPPPPGAPAEAPPPPGTPPRSGIPSGEEEASA